jgi:hypothetical protein
VTARHPLPVNAERGGHWSRGRGGVPDGAGDTTRPEISPPATTCTVRVAAS